MNIPPLNSSSPATVMRSHSTESGIPGQTGSFGLQTGGTSTTQAQHSREEIEKAAQRANDFLKPINNSIQFNVDDDTGITVVKVVDVATKEIIRQIPSEEMLAISQAIDTMKGLLVKQQA